MQEARPEVDGAADGSSIINGRLTATATAAWSIIFSALARTRDVEVDENGGLRRGDNQLGEDLRTEPQRLHDAIEEAGRLLLETGKLPDHAGLKADLIVTIDLTDLEQRTGRATTHHGGSLSVQQVLHLAADLNIIPAILDQELGLVEHGRGRRAQTQLDPPPRTPHASEEVMPATRVQSPLAPASRLGGIVAPTSGPS